MKRVRLKLKELTDSRRDGVKDVQVLVHDLNPLLRGGGNYFCTGNAARKFLQVDKDVVRRLNRFRWRRHRRQAKPGQRIRWDRETYEALGLHRLRGTVRAGCEKRSNTKRHGSACGRPLDAEPDRESNLASYDGNGTPYLEAESWSGCSETIRK